jgi:16S rRNA C967 or C1407 C5-methylase (RsmB/RsmF family)/NOL1/NOP2/fmu family ribosome biogenesis protein
MKDLPQELLKSLKSLPGFNEDDFVEAHRQENRITSVRLNPFKPAEPDFAMNEPVKWCLNSFYLRERPSFTHDPLFHAGCYYVQEAGSMFIEYALKSVLDFSQPLKVLDLCAAPGGKSTLISSLLNKESLLVANEVVKPRAGVLAQNLGRWGTHNTVVTNNNPEKFVQTPSFFDALVIDAPCSGSGLFRKQPEAIDEWSTGQVTMCGARQKRILSDALPALKSGGILVYSTCSYSVQENEDIVNWLIRDYKMEYIPLKVPKEWGIEENERGYRFYPHLTKSEGFFCAVLRKSGPSETIQNRRKASPFLLKSHEKEIISPFIEPNGCFFKNAGRLHFMNEMAFDFVNAAASGFYLKKAGICVGEIKGSDLVPDQDLAWYVELKVSNKTDLDKLQSLQYLKKQAFSIPAALPGFSLISYKRQGLGWAKILPNRINNYLPNELRILN